MVDGGYRLSREGVSALHRDGSGVAGFQAQHRQRVARPVTGADGKVHEVEANALETPLARYRASLTASQLQAGETFHRDYVRSSLMASVTRNWAIDAPVRGQGGAPCGPEDASLSRLAAKDRVLDALAAVGTSLEPVLMAVLVREESLAALERRFGWGARSGRVVLGLALDALARHYRLSV
ncbi:MAG: hypothetical protein GYB36_13330 [Alphaproteobacteria bacterium]|nr:hypothetical protein [Alphaproteobacteria bacterium]